MWEVGCLRLCPAATLGVAECLLLSRVVSRVSPVGKETRAFLFVHISVCEQAQAGWRIGALLRTEGGSGVLMSLGPAARCEVSTPGPSGSCCHLSWGV